MIVVGLYWDLDERPVILEGSGYDEYNGENALNRIAFYLPRDANCKVKPHAILGWDGKYDCKVLYKNETFINAQDTTHTHNPHFWSLDTAVRVLTGGSMDGDTYMDMFETAKGTSDRDFSILDSATWMDCRFGVSLNTDRSAVRQKRIFAQDEPHLIFLYIVGMTAPILIRILPSDFKLLTVHHRDGEKLCRILYPFYSRDNPNNDVKGCDATMKSAVLAVRILFMEWYMKCDFGKNGDKVFSMPLIVDVEKIRLYQVTSSH